MAVSPVVNEGAQRNERALKELARIHESYLAKFDALHQRQKRLLTAVMERIDREKAQQILSSINGGAKG